MEQTPTPRRRLNVLGKAERRKRIFARLREGWAYEEIAGEERLSAERIRQIVAEVLDKRVIDRGVDHAHLQLERLMPAMRIVGEAIGRGELKAVAPLIKMIDRLDKHQQTVVAKYTYGPEERERLLAKINALPTISSRSTARRPRRGQRSTKIIAARFPRNPLIRLDPDERIQGNPSFSNPISGRFRSETAIGQENPNCARAGRIRMKPSLRGVQRRSNPENEGRPTFLWIASLRSQ